MFECHNNHEMIFFGTGMGLQNGGFCPICMMNLIAQSNEQEEMIFKAQLLSLMHNANKVTAFDDQENAIFWYRSYIRLVRDLKKLLME